MRGSPILRVSARLFVPAALLFSLLLLARGHNEPGGGFAGGLTAAAAAALYGAAFGADRARRIIPLPPRSLMGAGLGLALASAVPGMAAGGAVFRGRWAELELPGWGALPAGTPLLFDAGVYLLVLGAASEIVLTLAEERE